MAARAPVNVSNSRSVNLAFSSTHRIVGAEHSSSVSPVPSFQMAAIHDAVVSLQAADFTPAPLALFSLNFMNSCLQRCSMREKHSAKIIAKGAIFELMPSRQLFIKLRERGPAALVEMSRLLLDHSSSCALVAIGSFHLSSLAPLLPQLYEQLPFERAAAA